MSRKAAVKKAFFNPEHGGDLSRDLAKEYLRQAGVTNQNQVSNDPNDPQFDAIREVLRSSLRRPRKLAKRSVKRLARK